MTGFYMKHNAGLKWVKYASGVINIYFGHLFRFKGFLVLCFLIFLVYSYVLLMITVIEFFPFNFGLS